MNLVTGRAPSSRWRSQMLPTEEPAAQVGKDVKVNFFAHGGPAPPGRSGMVAPAESISDFSTANPERGANQDIRPGETKRTGGGAPLQRTRAASLLLTWKAVLDAEVLGEAAGWEAQPFPMFPARHVDDIPFDFTIDMLIVELATDGGPVIVVDAGSPSGSGHSLGILVRNDHCFLSTEALKRLRAFIAINDGRWRDKAGSPRKLPGYRVSPLIRNGGVREDPSRYAKLIYDAINAALADEAPDSA